MAKTNRECHFCGKGYYFCPSCRDKRDPQIYSMFDSEKCRDAFNILRDEFLQKLSTEEAHNKLIEMRIVESQNKPNEHLRRVLAYSPITTVEEVNEETVIEVENEMIEEKVVDNIEGSEIVIEQMQETPIPAIRPESYKRYRKRNKNSEVIAETE